MITLDENGKVGKNIEETKENVNDEGRNFKTFIYLIVVCCLFSFAAGYFLGIRNSVSSKGTGIDTVTEQFGKLEKNQHGITSGITDAASASTELTETINVGFEAVGRLEESIRVGQKQVEELGKSVDRLEVNVRESGKLIERSESIIKTIFARGEENKVKN